MFLACSVRLLLSFLDAGTDDIFSVGALQLPGVATTVEGLLRKFRILAAIASHSLA